ncbi:hypothetical protein ABK040_005989 [Willaertia magna]
MKDIPGVIQPLESVVQIPILSPYFFIGSFVETFNLANTIGEKETKTFRITFPDRNYLFICDKNLLKEYFVTKGHDFTKPKHDYDLMNVFGKNILTALNDEEWKRHHNVCYHAVDNNSLEYMCKVAVESTDLLFSKKWDIILNENNNKGFELDVSDYTDVTLDILGKTAFDLDFGVFSDAKDGKEFRKAIEVLLFKGLVIRKIFTNETIQKIVYKITGVDKDYKLISDTLDKIIKKRHEELENGTGDIDRCDLLSSLVKANFKQEDDKSKLTNEELKSNAFIFLLAGHETTATTLQWITYELAKNQDIQNKARKILDEMIGTNNPTPEDYNNDVLVYLKCIMLETLRLHPPIYAVAKDAKKNVTLSGKFKIPKDTLVVAHIYATNRNDKYWDNPDTFNPDRFLEKEFRQKSESNFTFIPFAMGTRKCLGFEFSQKETCMLLAKMLQKYQFILLNDESNEKDRITPKTTITTRPHGLRVLVKRRD